MNQPKFSRRSALALGTLGGLGLGLSDVLRQEAQAAKGTPKGSAKAKSVIFLWLQGGVSHHETFDMKPDAPEDIRGELQPIQTNLSGVQVSELLPELSQKLDKLAVIRSVTHRESAHERGSMYMVAGRRPTGNGINNTWPDIGSIVGHELGMRGGLPPYVSVPGNDFTTKFIGPGYLPQSADSFKGVHAKSLSSPSGFSSERFENRNSLRNALTADSTYGQTWDDFDQKAIDIMLSGKAGKAFDHLQESDEIKDLYGIEQTKKGKSHRDYLGDYCLQARRLVEAGVRFVTIGRNSWDHHSNMFPQLKSRVPRFDKAFAGLVTDLEQRGMLDDTLVVYMTEFGRTPKINKDAGRDHWPGAFSVAFAGAGIKTGQVIGASDKQGGQVVQHPVSPEELAATILHLVGIDPHGVFVGDDARPVFYVEQAKPIQTLLS